MVLRYPLCPKCFRRYEEAEPDEQVRFLTALDPDNLSAWISSQGRMYRRLATAPIQDAVCRYCGRPVPKGPVNV